MSCSGCSMGIFDFANVLNDNNRLLEFLQMHHVIATERICERCRQSCRRDLARKLFRCDRRHSRVDCRRRRTSFRCNYCISMFAGTWFAGVHLPIEKVCKLNYLWLTLPCPRICLIAREVSVSLHTVIDWSSFSREVCMFWLEQRSDMLGGVNVVVEIDEAKFGRRKYNRGRWIEGQWVFGGFERGSKRCF